MAGTGSIGNGMDDRAAYAQSFGSMAHKTVYSKPDIKGGLIKKDEFVMETDVRGNIKDAYSAGIVSLKAHGTTSGGAGTAGFAMVPVFVDPKIIDRTRKNTPLTELIPRVTNQGMFADFNVITGKGGAFTRGEDAALTETNTTYDRQSTAIDFLYAVGRVTGPSIAAQPSYVLAGMQPAAGAVSSFTDIGAPNAKQQEVLVKAREIKELEENLLINGNATTSGIAGNPNGTEFSGIITLMGATNTVDKNTSALDLDDYTTAIQNAFDDGGRPNLGVCSSGVFSDTLKLLQSKIGYLQAMQQVFWGFNTVVLQTMVGPVPLIPSMFMSNVSGSKAAYFLDLEVVEMRVLQDMTFEELAKTNDSQKFMLKIYETFIIRAVTFCSSITEISA